MRGADVGGVRQKVGFNTNHNMRSHIRGRGVEAEQEQNPRPLRNRVLQTIFVLKKWQIRPHPLRVCANILAVAERECQNLPVSAPQPLLACVNVALCGVTETTTT